MKNTEKTARERFEEERKRISEDHAAVNGQPPSEEDELDQDVDEVLDEESEAENEVPEDFKQPEMEEATTPVDRNMGLGKKIEVTREQHIDSKKQKEMAEQLMGLRRANTEHLSPEDQKRIHTILAKAEANKLDHPLLNYLIREKVTLATQYVQATVAIKTLQQQLLKQVSEASNGLVKCKGAIENNDRQILDLVTKNPELLD